MSSAHIAVPVAASWYRYAHLLIVYLVWGSTYFAVKIVVHGDTAISPLQLQTWRMWCASLLLIAIAVATPRQRLRISVRDITLCAISGTLMWVLGNGLATLASRHAASAFIVMAMGMIPLWTTLLSSVVNRKAPSRRIVSGILVGLVGLLFIFSPPALSADTSAVEPGYGLWIVVVLTAAGVTWSLGTILQRPLLEAIPTPLAAGLQMFSAAIVLTGVSLATGETLTVPSGIGFDQLVAFLFLTVFGSTICLISYLRVLKAFTPAIASTFAYVNPIVGVALGWAFLLEAPTIWALLGMTMVLIGVFVVLVQPSFLKEAARSTN